MNVSGTGAMAQMQQQMQTQKMDGNGQGQGVHKGQGQGGANGMKDIMQSLSPEDRATFSAELQSMNSEQKAAFKDDLKAIDSTNMDSGAYLDALMAVINGDFSSTSTSSSEFVTEVYA